MRLFLVLTILLISLAAVGCRDNGSCGPHKKACINGTCAANGWAKPATGKDHWEQKKLRQIERKKNKEK